MLLRTYSLRPRNTCRLAIFILLGVAGFPVFSAAWQCTDLIEPIDNVGSLTVELTQRDNVFYGSFIRSGTRFYDGPLKRSANWLIYTELYPGIQDERIETRRLLRFDPTTGLLIYIVNYPEVNMIYARCIESKSE